MKNLGSISRLRYIRLSSVYSIGNADEQYSATITLNSGEDFTDFPFQLYSPRFTEKKKDNDQGNFFTQELKWRVMLVEGGIAHLLANLHCVPLILLITDGNGRTVILGSKKIPAYITYSVMRPDKPSDPTYYEVTIKRESDRPAYFYRTDPAGTVPPDEPPSYD